MRSTIVILNMSRSGMVQMLTLIGYSIGLPDIAEADELNHSHSIPHNDRLKPDKVLSFSDQLV